MSECIVVLDEGLYVDLVLKLHIRQFPCFVWGWSHRNLWVRLRRLKALNSTLITLLSAWSKLVLFLREILEHFGEDLLVDRLYDFLRIVVSQLFGNHIAAGIAEALDVLLGLSWVVEAYRTLMLINQRDLLVELRPILAVIKHKHIYFLISVICRFS